MRVELIQIVSENTKPFPLVEENIFNKIGKTAEYKFNKNIFQLVWNETDFTLRVNNLPTMQGQKLTYSLITLDKLCSNSNLKSFVHFKML